MGLSSVFEVERGGVNLGWSGVGMGPLGFNSLESSTGRPQYHSPFRRIYQLYTRPNAPKGSICAPVTLKVGDSRVSVFMAGHHRATLCHVVPHVTCGDVATCRVCEGSAGARRALHARTAPAYLPTCVLIIFRSHSSHSRRLRGLKSKVASLGTSLGNKRCGLDWFGTVPVAFFDP